MARLVLLRRAAMQEKVKQNLWDWLDNGRMAPCLEAVKTKSSAVEMSDSKNISVGLVQDFFNAFYQIGVNIYHE